jgi:putative FmdB family regulatory protein
MISIIPQLPGAQPLRDGRRTASEASVPIYEFRCESCGRKINWFRRSFAEAAEAPDSCPRCGGAALTRLISRVAVLRSEESRLDALADSGRFDDLDEADPSSMGRWMKRMGREMGEDLGDEFTEIVDRLESGQTPEDIEESFPDPGDEASASEIS